jgi:pimeloyl-ACP methyl ester carboxylesterase
MFTTIWGAMMTFEVLHFGGNGHAAIRLEAARAALARRPKAPQLVDVPYPGFEGRRRVDSLEEFLDELAAFCRARPCLPAAAIATGIGALIALSLRARGELDLPLIFQGPVLWGLERRRFPALMRMRLARDLLRKVFAVPQFQDWFVHRYFVRPLDDCVRGRFFEGYAQCVALGDLFRWFDPQWLRAQGRRFAERPGSLRTITVWLGGRDRVVDRLEVDRTEKILGVCWPRVEFPGWGHYPMIDVPEEWADALCDAVAGP